VRWSSPVGVNAEGRFELGGIPAGDYTLTVNRFRSGGFVPLTLKEIHLADGDAKSLDIRQGEIPESELSKEVVGVAVFTPEGIPLPGCDVRLAGANGPLKPTRSSLTQIWFAPPPGSYQLSAAYLGAAPVTQTVEIKPTLKNGTWSTQDHVLNLTLSPID